MSFLCLFMLRSFRLDANIFWAQAIIYIACNQLHLTTNLLISCGFGCPEFRLRFHAFTKFSTHLFIDKFALDKTFLLWCIHIFCIQNWEVFSSTFSTLTPRATGDHDDSIYLLVLYQYKEGLSESGMFNFPGNSFCLFRNFQYWSELTDAIKTINAPCFTQH